MTNRLEIVRRLEELEILIEHEKLKDEKEVQELKTLHEKIKALQLDYTTRENKLYRRYNDYTSEQRSLNFDLRKLTSEDK